MTTESPKHTLWSRFRLPLELKVLLALLVIIGGTWGFLELGEAVNAGTTKDFDDGVLKALRDPGNNNDLIGPPWVKEVARDITALGGYFVLFFVSTIVCSYLVLIGKWAASTFIAIASLTGWLVSSLLKAAFDRPRPDVVEHLSHAFTSSFPSGHSMMSAVVYLTMGALLARFANRGSVRIYCLSVAIFLSGIIGCSRVAMGVHYPTDVLGGWTAGLVWATLCWLIARKWQKSHPGER
jgi:undecaprenyl-diphosphatase